MEPIAESAEIFRLLAGTGGPDLGESLQQMALHVVEVIPECVGISISYFDEDVTVTFLATSERLRVLDAAQYLSGGPCEDAAREGAAIDVPDLMDEQRWGLLAQAGAVAGVKSSLSLPLRHANTVYGSVNLYGHTSNAFRGHTTAIARIFATEVGDAVTNADLSMASLSRARRAVETLETYDTINRAAGLLASKENIRIEEAFARLYEAARRAEVSPGVLADLVLKEHGGN